MPEQKNVRIFSLPTWPTCKKAKRFLEKNGIQYQNLDVGESEEARDEMVKLSGQLGVPVIDVDGEILLDFNEKELKGKLGI